jgi:SWI2/SNF2 ATPase
MAHPFTPLNHFSPWNLDDDGNLVRLGEVLENVHLGTELEFLIEGVFNPDRFLQLQRNFTAFDSGADGYTKRIAKPHQYFAVTKAVGATVEAVESNGKAGVVWRTQGSGKLMEMELYAQLVSKQPTTRADLVDGPCRQRVEESTRLAAREGIRWTAAAQHPPGGCASLPSNPAKGNGVPGACRLADSGRALPPRQDRARCDLAEQIH